MVNLEEWTGSSSKGRILGRMHHADRYGGR
jgi:hypothetical protein